VKAQNPATTTSGVNIDSLPESQIDIPIQINLRPIYALAEKNVDTVFTSPSYPSGWIQADCATRYKYHFRRSPLRMAMNGTTLNLGFTGYYKITGSTRVCIGGTVLSPWTPDCNCGFSEGERKVNIGFSSTFSLRPDHLLLTKIIRTEPQAVDKCEVCFWGQDITKTVLNGLKSELDLSRKAMEDSFGRVNLRPYMQQAWNMLSTVYSIPNVGYFSLNPKSLRMDNLAAKNDLLNLSIGITATPVVSFEKGTSLPTPVPNLSTAKTPEGFNVFLEAALQYDSLSQVMNTYLVDKRFNLSEGLIKKHIIIKQTAVSGDTLGNLVIRLDFEGSHKGSVNFIGKPFYDESTRTIQVRDLDYDLTTKDWLLRTAKWLFDKKIINELKKYTSFDLTSYYDTATQTINTWLNREWTKGIRGTGSVHDLKLTAVHAQPQHLLIRSNCVGKLAVVISEFEF
jgi:hypothetical protein